MLLFVNLVVIGQVLPSSLRVKKIEIISDSTLLDSLSIVPGSMVVMSNNQFVSDSSYLLLPVQSILVWLSPVKGEVIITYRVYPLNFNKTYFHKDTNSIFHHGGNSPVPFRFPTVNRQSEIFNMGGINKSGSISRGVMFGNNQDLSINSNLNLQLSGKISSNISILASVTDDNLPIQPEGNTQQLQDFDQVFIQLFSDTWRLTAGDFWMKKPDGYFLNYNKRAQGGSFTKVSNNVLKKHKNADTIMSFVENRFSAAISKGKFARNVIQGVEGNQGPYRLSGAENEQFVIVLSGTEMVYIDGMLLTRGQENDYVIDYNTSEIEFTPKQLITKDKRITIEFQYSDKNYARSVVESSNLFNVNDWKVHLNVYSEQDSKNQPLQQDLLQSEKDLLAQVGDDLQIDYYVVDESNELVEESRSFRIRAIAPMEGLAADPLWMPNFPGVSVQMILLIGSQECLWILIEYGIKTKTIGTITKEHPRHLSLSNLALSSGLTAGVAIRRFECR